MEQKSIKNGIEKTIEKRRAARWLSWASQGPRRPTRETNAGAAWALTRSLAPRGDNIKRQLNKTSTYKISHAVGQWPGELFVIFVQPTVSQNRPAVV